MTGIGGVGGAGAGGAIGAGLPIGGATALMAGMHGQGATAVKGLEAGAQSGMRAPEAVARGDQSPLQALAKKLDDLLTTALMLELMDRDDDKEGNGIADAVVAATAVALYKEMQSLDGAGAAGVTISITA